MQYLLDTNTCIAAMRNDPAVVQGQMIGPYDVLIAGHAIATGLALVTDNTTEFLRVPGLRVENWRTTSGT
jgi:predicted nucleic acid-binding protein